MPDHLLPEKCNTLAEAAQAVGAIEDADRDYHYICDSGAQARQLVKLLGGQLPYPDAREHQPYIIYSRNGELKCETPTVEGETMPKPWQLKKKVWRISLRVRADQRPAAERTADIDDDVRSVSILGGDGLKIDAGFFLRDGDGRWHRRSTEKARLQLFAQHGDDSKTRRILGNAAGAPWELVNVPFAPEYPAARQWNICAPQLKYAPVAGSHPSWDMILDHIGQELSAALASHAWGERSGIATGAQYLTAWAAWMIRYPFQSLPYLFLHGEQNSGKSILHEALGELMTKGVASADSALTNSSDFNGELANAVLAYVEEKNIKLARGAYNKIKDWVTSPVFWVHKKGQQPYPQRNCLHFIHTANDRACPIDFGDTRITMLYVPPFRGEEVPKEMLLARLREEGPAFTHTLLNFPLPPLEGRLGLPVISTESKQEEIDDSAPPLIRALTDFMVGRDYAEITTTKFAAEFGPGDWPSDLRRVKSIVEANAKYLRSKCIQVTYPPERTKDGYRMALSRKPT
jgi:hypothetical protein